jgi:bifunctional DNA-binding transcriptional regulator/antitoxin component of YhaV-PrlF toxin-antitoxin module
MAKRVFLTIQNRGLVAIPTETRRRYGLDQPGVQLEVIEREGELVLRPHIPIPSDQAWFWTDKWQGMEREANADIKTGRVKTSEDVNEFLAELES